MRRPTYALLAGLAAAGMFVAEIVAKIGWLGNWSATAYIVVSLALLAALIAALVLGVAHDEDLDGSGPDDDY
ncbi:MAG TPA: hypothetical protein VGL39_28440 [Jatrophihabitantaceae bacterium]|jgi:hypothetical protein